MHSNIRHNLSPPPVFARSHTTPNLIATHLSTQQPQFDYNVSMQPLPQPPLSGLPHPPPPHSLPMTGNSNTTTATPLIINNTHLTRTLSDGLIQSTHIRLHTHTPSIHNNSHQNIIGGGGGGGVGMGGGGVSQQSQIQMQSNNMGGGGSMIGSMSQQQTTQQSLSTIGESTTQQATQQLTLTLTPTPTLQQQTQPLHGIKKQKGVLVYDLCLYICCFFEGCFVVFFAVFFGLLFENFGKFAGNFEKARHQS